MSRKWASAGPSDHIQTQNTPDTRPSPHIQPLVSLEYNHSPCHGSRPSAGGRSACGATAAPCKTPSCGGPQAHTRLRGLRQVLLQAGETPHPGARRLAGWRRALLSNFDLDSLASVDPGVALAALKPALGQGSTRCTCQGLPCRCPGTPHAMHETSPQPPAPPAGGGLQGGGQRAQRDVLRQVAHEQRHAAQEGGAE